MRLSSTLLMLFSSFALAQTDGILPFDAIESHSAGIDSINLQNLNVLLNVPIRSKSGAFPFDYHLQGNSNCEHYTNSSNKSYALCGITPKPKGTTPNNGMLVGFTSGLLGAKVISQTLKFILCDNINGGQSLANAYTNWIIVEPNGTVHQLSPTDEIDYPNTQYNQPACVKYQFRDTAQDNSGLSAYVLCGPGPGCPWANPTTTTAVYDASGRGVSSTATPPYADGDSNGNTIYSTTSGHVTTYVDTLGGGNGSSGVPSPLTVTTDVNGIPTFSWHDVVGGWQTVSIQTTKTLLHTAFSCPTWVDTSNSALVPTAINFPDGANIAISYEATPGGTGFITGRVSTITNRAGGSVTYTYSGGNNNNGLDCTYFVPPILTRTTSDGQRTYTWAAVNNGNGNYGNTTTVVDSGGNKTVYTFTGLTYAGNAAPPVMQALTEVQRYQGSSGPPLSTDVICYNTITTGCPTAVVSYPITERDVYHTIAGMSTSSRTKTTYDKYGNVLTTAKYDFGATSPTQQTTTTYGSWNGTACVGYGIANKPCDVKTTAGANTLAETRFAYDSYGAGNLLTLYSWNGSSWLSSTTPNSYNANGTIAVSYDIANNPTAYTYNGTYGCNNLFPTSMISGGLTSYNTWACDGGVLSSHTDANGKITAYGFQNSSGVADPFWRQSEIVDPLGNITWKSYAPVTVENSLTFGSSLSDGVGTSDGYQRSVRKQKNRNDGSGNYDTTSVSYGWSGNYRTVSKTLPCAVSLGSDCSFSSGVTLTQIDPLGRPYLATDGGGGTVTNTYSQNDVKTTIGSAPSGENTKSIQTEYDGLGRVKSVCQILITNPTGGASCGQNTAASGYLTSYAYSTFAGGTQVAVTRSLQTRSKKYDALRRLVFDSEPESGVVTYTYDILPANTCGSNSLTNSSGDLMARSDADGNIVCYFHDSLHRVTDEANNNQSSTNACRRFRFDSTANVLHSVPNGATLANLEGRMVEASTDNCVSPFTAITDEFFSYDADGRLTEMWESTPHSGGFYHTTVTLAANGAITSLGGIPGYTSVSYGLDAQGRLSTALQGTTKVVCDAACSTTTSTSFDPAGRPLAVKIGGTSDNDTYTYDPNSGRMKTYTFTVGATPKSVAGTLTWNPNGTLGALAITDGFNVGGNQTCTFGTSSVMGYDDLGRLVSDNCGSVWNQAFSYDQYDNITKAGSGSWACAACYDQTSNRYNNVLSGSISYDNAGNLLNDTFNKYTWDVYGHPATIGGTSGTVTCGTSGTCLTYDANGHMVEKNAAGVYSEILYSPVGKTATMTGQSTTNVYFPLPGGATLYEAGGILYFWHKDWLGSARFGSQVGTRSSIYDRAFAPYGEMYQNFGQTTQLNFTGDTQDTVPGLFDTANRELNPSQGRWVSPDPARAGWNLYSYSTNPNRSIDPSGLRDLDGSSNGWDSSWGPGSGGGSFGSDIAGAFFGFSETTLVAVPSNSGADPIAQLMNNINGVVGAVFQPELALVNWGFLNWNLFQPFVDRGMADTTVTVGWFKNTPLNPYGHIALGVGDSPMVGLNPDSDGNFIANLALQSFACAFVLCNPLATTAVPGVVSQENPNQSPVDSATFFISAEQGIAIQTAIGLSADNPPPWSVKGPLPACDCGSWAQQMLGFGGIATGRPEWEPEAMMVHVHDAEYTQLP